MILRNIIKVLGNFYLHLKKYWQYLLKNLIKIDLLIYFYFKNISLISQIFCTEFNIYLWLSIRFQDKAMLNLNWKYIFKCN